VNQLPTFIPCKPFHRRARATDQAPPTPPPLALTLLAATYDDVNLQLVLTFDRAVNIAAFDGSAILVGDATFNHTAYDGTAAPPSLDAPGIVRIYLNPTGPFFSTEVDFTATGGTGIAAVDDGCTWPGTPGIVFLPYP
jgi:hypothetical protein